MLAPSKAEKRRQPQWEFEYAVLAEVLTELGIMGVASSELQVHLDNRDRYRTVLGILRIYERRWEIKPTVVAEDKCATQSYLHHTSIYVHLRLPWIECALATSVQPLCRDSPSELDKTIMYRDSVIFLFSFPARTIPLTTPTPASTTDVSI
jgi:hypothetical protein